LHKIYSSTCYLLVYQSITNNCKYKQSPNTQLRIDSEKLSVNAC